MALITHLQTISCLLLAGPVLSFWLIYLYHREKAIFYSMGLMPSVLTHVLTFHTMSSLMVPSRAHLSFLSTPVLKVLNDEASIASLRRLFTSFLISFLYNPFPPYAGPPSFFLSFFCYALWQPYSLPHTTWVPGAWITKHNKRMVHRRNPNSLSPAYTDRHSNALLWK